MGTNSMSAGWSPGLPTRKTNGSVHWPDPNTSPTSMLRLAFDCVVALLRVDERDLCAKVPGKGRNPGGALFHDAVRGQGHQLAMEGMPWQANAKVAQANSTQMVCGESVGLRSSTQISVGSPARGGYGSMLISRSA